VKIDWENLNFLDYDLRFYTYDEFCKRCKRIKFKYSKLNTNQKIFYHFYIYANQHMLLLYKDRIQDYLEDECTEEDLFKILKFYKPR